MANPPDGTSAAGMPQIFDAFWRAAAYCLHPRLIVWSLLPLVLIVGLTYGLGFFFWGDAVAMVRHWLDAWPWFGSIWSWVEARGWPSLREWAAPVLVVMLAVPIIIVASLLAVALLVTPTVVAMVAQRRFPDAQRRRGASWWLAVLWSLGHTVVALLLLAVSVPFWLIPPLVLVLPPLIWGWLTYRVMAFDALAEHASAHERRELMHQYRWPLLGIGVLCGYLGAAPALVWALGALTVVLAPLLVVASVWLYTLVFIFSSAWFTHYMLAALEARRRQPPAPATRWEVVESAPPALPSAAAKQAGDGGVGDASAFAPTDPGQSPPRN